MARKTKAGVAAPASAKPMNSGKSVPRPATRLGPPRSIKRRVPSATPVPATNDALPWFKFFSMDFLGDVMVEELTPAQGFAALLLTARAWTLPGCRLTVEPARLCRIARVSLAEWMRDGFGDEIMKVCFRREDWSFVPRLFNLPSQQASAIAERERKRAGGQASAAERLAKFGTAQPPSKTPAKTLPKSVPKTEPKTLRPASGSGSGSGSDVGSESDADVSVEDGSGRERTCSWVSTTTGEVCMALVTSFGTLCQEHEKEAGACCSRCGRDACEGDCERNIEP